MEKNELLNAIMDALPVEPDRVTHRIWQSDGEILTPTEESAEAIADFLEALTGMEMNTAGRYEPEDGYSLHDIRNGYYPVYCT